MLYLMFGLRELLLLLLFWLVVLLLLPSDDAVAWSTESGVLKCIGDMLSCWLIGGEGVPCMTSW